MEPYEQAGNLQLICRYPEASSLEDLLVGFRVHLEEFAPSLIVLDSISSIEHASSEKGFRQFMIGVAALLRKHGRSALLDPDRDGRRVRRARPRPTCPRSPTPSSAWTTRRAGVRAAALDPGDQGARRNPRQPSLPPEHRPGRPVGGEDAAALGPGPPRDRREGSGRRSRAEAHAPPLDARAARPAGRRERRQPRDDRAGPRAPRLPGGPRDLRRGALDAPPAGTATAWSSATTGFPTRPRRSCSRTPSGTGLLEGTATLVMSGQPDPVGVEPHELIRKPLDLDAAAPPGAHRASAPRRRGPSRGRARPRPSTWRSTSACRGRPR